MLNRFAISLLSKFRKNEALIGELMVDKRTGEIVLKGLNGEILSYNKHTRLNQHIGIVTLNSQLLDNLGKLYEIEFNDILLPSVVEEDVNILDEEVNLLNKKASKILISLDIDSLHIDAEGAINPNPLQLTVELLLASNITTQTQYTISRTLELDKNNITLFIPEYPVYDPGDTVDYNCILKSIKINRNNLDVPEDNIRYILNSILYVVSEVS